MISLLAFAASTRGGSTKARTSSYSTATLLIAEYLGAALEDRNPDVFLQAVADVARARGISKLAKDAGLERESLYKALASSGKIRYDTVRKVLDSLGVRFTLTD